MKSVSLKSCTCEVCVGFCRNRPGWFLPGEAELAAEYLEISLEQLFKGYLGVDWWGSPAVYVLSPAHVGMQTGEEYGPNPMGQCVFLEEGRCRIHAVKPYECRVALHDNQENARKCHEKIAESWENHQSQIEDLLGYSLSSPLWEMAFACLAWGAVGSKL